MIDQVPPNELAGWFARDASAPAVLLDVREPWELQTAGVTPQGENHRIACLCHHGARSQRVAAFLTQNGFAEVANVAGGIDAWSALHDPSVPRY